MAELDRKGTHSAAGSGDQHGLPRLHPCPVHDHLPGGQAGDGKRGALVERAAFRQRVDPLRSSDGKLGVASATVGDHPVAGLEPLHPCADVHHLTGEVTAQDMRRGEARAVRALSCEHIESIQRTGAHANEDVVGSHGRLR